VIGRRKEKESGIYDDFARETICVKTDFCRGRCAKNSTNSV